MSNSHNFISKVIEGNQFGTVIGSWVGEFVFRYWALVKGYKAHVRAIQLTILLSSVFQVRVGKTGKPRNEYPSDSL